MCCEQFADDLSSCNRKNSQIDYAKTQRKKLNLNFNGKKFFFSVQSTVHHIRFSVNVFCALSEYSVNAGNFTSQSKLFGKQTVMKLEK